MSRILAVDDMEFNRHHLRKILESEGFEVDTACATAISLHGISSGPRHTIWWSPTCECLDLSGLELLAKVLAA